MVIPNNVWEIKEIQRIEVTIASGEKVLQNWNGNNFDNSFEEKIIFNKPWNLLPFVYVSQYTII